MILPLSGLTPEGTVFEGEDPAEALAWPPSPRDVVRPAGPMRWRLKAQLFGPEVLVTGRAEALFEGVCCRCGGPLSRVFGDDFTLSRAVGPEVTELDLTSELREAILLALPNNPVCPPDCKGVAAAALKKGRSPRKDAPASGPWGALDKLFGDKSPEP